MLDNVELKTLFVEWLSSAVSLRKGSLVSLDGKNLCGSKEGLKGKKALNIVSAWASEASVVLGQVRCAREIERDSGDTGIVEHLEVGGLYRDDRRDWMSEKHRGTH